MNIGTRETITYACTCNGVPELAPQIKITVSNRIKVSAGNADSKKNLISIGANYLNKCTEEELYKTVIHETCHLVVRYKYGNVTSHGKEWKKAMLNCGVEPKVYHNVKLRVYNFINCKCGQKVRFGKKYWNRYKNKTANFRCPSCNEIL